MGGLAPLTIATLVIGAAASGATKNVSCRGGDAAAGPVLLQRSAHLLEGSHEAALAGRCDAASWPDKDHGLVCGECKVLVDRFDSVYKTCSGYCESIGRQCTGAWEEQDDNCAVKHTMTCDQSIRSSDAICECGTEAASDPSPADAGEPACYGDLGDLAVDEGAGVGQKVDTKSASECEEACNGQAGCNSFSLCPQWGCFMLAKSFSGGEATKSHGGCRTYYKKPCGSGGAPAPAAPAPSPPAVSFTVKVMSYNTEYIGYPPRGSSRIHLYAAKIQEVGAAVVGVQECLDRSALAEATGSYKTIWGPSSNTILYDPSKVSYVEGSAGYMTIPRDNYAERFFVWAQFSSGGSTWWFFNSHFPHNHNEATSPNTHARIAQMLLQKFKDLGITNSPIVVVGDFNPFASNGASMGSFESNLVAGGFFRAYKARGNPGFPGLDKIFASSAHWWSSNEADHGTGGSDHPAISADLTLRA